MISLYFRWTVHSLFQLFALPDSTICTSFSQPIRHRCKALLIRFATPFKLFLIISYIIIITKFFLKIKLFFYTRHTIAFLLEYGYEIWSVKVHHYAFEAISLFIISVSYLLNVSKSFSISLSYIYIITKIF